jgi:hypothetical protein
MDYDQFRRMLQVNKHRLDDELEIHADIQERIGHERARLEVFEAEKKNELALCEARLTEQFKEDDPKTTKDQIEAKVIRSRERKAAWEAYQTARVERLRWDSLYDAWKARDFAVRTLARLFGDQYFANDPVLVRERRRRDENLDEQRAQLRQASARASADSKPQESGRRRID